LTRVGAKARKLHKLFARAKFAHKLFVFSLNTSADPVAPLLADTLALDPMTILIHGLHIQSITVQHEGLASSAEAEEHDCFGNTDLWLHFHFGGMEVSAVGLL